MSFKIFNLSRYQWLNRKWLIRISLAILAAFFSASVSLGMVKGELVIGNRETSSPSSIANSEQLLQQGREFFQAEQFDQAVTVWQQAVAKFKTSGNLLNEALALNYLSLAYQQIGQWTEAKDAIYASLLLLPTQANSDKTKERLSVLAQVLNTQGHLQLALGQGEQALSSWEQATVTYRQIGDLEGAIGSQINQAQALENLGLYRRAKKTLEEVEISLQSQPSSLMKATGLRSIGNVLRLIGDLEESRNFLQQSLKIAQSIQSSSAISAAQFSLGNTARSLAKRAEDLQDESTQRTETEAAIKAYQQVIETSMSAKMRLPAQLNLLSLLVNRQQFREAEALRSQINIAQLPPSRRSVYARINLAQSLTKLATAKLNTETSQQTVITFPEIAQILAIAVQESRNIKDQRAESYALGNLGRLYEQAGKPQDSLNLTQKALVLAQEINASDIAYRWQWQLGRLLKDRGDKKSAIAAYTVAVKTLKSLRSDLVAVNPDNPDVQFSFRDSVEPVYREFVDLLVTTEAEPSQENLDQARQVIESLQLAELDNFFQEACLEGTPVQVDQIDSTSAVIYPIILPERLAIIVALPQSSLRLYSQPIPQKEVENLLDELQQDIGRVAANNQQVLRQSQQIYDWIIRPVEADLKKSNVQSLVFILDGLLRNIPMAALHDGRQYLIEKYSIALTPGLQLLAPQSLKREQVKVLMAGLSESRQGFSALPNVEKELNTIKSQINSQELLNQQFTDKNLRKELNLNPFPIVHIATHGQFSSQANRTFILTWDDKINAKEFDNLLRRRSQEVSHPIELLVLSACETADGDKRATLGLAGIAVRAGAISTLGTLWQVSDTSTADLMVRFYQELAKPDITKAEALRQAQISILRQNKYKLPYYWAPYVLVGNWR